MRFVLLLGIGISVDVGGVARADDPVPEWAHTADAPLHRPTVTQSVYASMERLSSHLDRHIRALSFDHLELQFDARQRTARLAMGLGNMTNFGLGVRGHVLITGSVARVDTRIDLAISGTRLNLKLPELELIPRNHRGSNYLEVRLPVLHRRF